MNKIFILFYTVHDFYVKNSFFIDNQIFKNSIKTKEISFIKELFMKIDRLI